MSRARAERETRRLQRIAARLEQEGFSVALEPPPSQLPSWLRSFQPDLVARHGDEGVVVEVKSRKELHGSDYLDELVRVVEARPGWRLQLDVSNPRQTQPEEEEIAPLSQPRIEEHLEASRQLLRLGLNEAALVNSWAALEGAARRVLSDAGTEPPRSTRGLLRALWINGYLDPSARDHLDQISVARNNATHGVEAAQERDPSDYETLYRITRELLAAKP